MKLSQFITEALKGTSKIEDMETLTYPDGTIIDVKSMMNRFETASSFIHTNYSYFSPALSELIPIYTNSVNTMATDGVRIFINPYFMEKELNNKQLMFVIMHELMHCILMHISRAKSYGHDHERSNIAGDYEINGLLATTGVISASQIKSIKALYDEQYLGLAYETIYRMNPESDGMSNSGGDSQGEPNSQSDSQDGSQGEPNSQSGSQDGSQSGSQDGSQSGSQRAGGNSKSSAAKAAQKGEIKSGGAFIDPETGKKIAEESGYNSEESGGDKSTSEVSNKWKKIAMSSAGNIGSGTGKGKLMDSILQILKPSKNWKSELRRYIGNSISKDEEDRLGRKSFLHQDILKDYTRPMENSLSKVVFMIDTSGSVSDDQLMKILSESHHIVTQKKVPQVTYIYYDYGITGTENIKRSKQKPDIMKAIGRGGTSFKRACEDFLKMSKRKTELTIVFTDGDTIEEVSTKPRNMKNVIFVVIDRPSTPDMPYGKTLHINSKDVE